jgi:hypothetical protein
VPFCFKFVGCFAVAKSTAESFPFGRSSRSLTCFRIVFGFFVDADFVDLAREEGLVADGGSG